MDMAGKALLAYMAGQARLRQHKGARHRMVEENVHIAERNSPELARRMREALRAQQELDTYVLSLIPTSTAPRE